MTALKDALEAVKAENDALLEAERLLESNGYTVTFDHGRSPPPPPAGDTVLVPRDDTKRSFADPLLPREMVAAGEDAIDKAHEDLQNYVSGKTIDWDSGMIAVAVYRAMVEWWCRSAPSIHQGGCAPIVTDGVQGGTALLAASPLPAQEVNAVKEGT